MRVVAVQTWEDKREHIGREKVDGVPLGRTETAALIFLTPSLAEERLTKKRPAQHIGRGASLSVAPLREMELEISEPPFPFCRVGRRQLFLAQYDHACPPASVLPPHSSSRVSADVLIRCFNHHPLLFCCPNCPASLSRIYSYPPSIRPPSPPASLIITPQGLFFPCHLLTQNCSHFLLFRGRDAVTHIRNTFFIAFSLRQLSFASLCGDRP